MSINVLGAQSSVGSQYDFTSITSAGLLNAAHSLANQNKISSLEESQLVGTASGADSCSISGAGQSVSDVLQDPTRQNFISVMQEQLASAQSTGSTQTAELDAGILKDLSLYQRNDPLESGNTTSIQA